MGRGKHFSTPEQLLANSSPCPRTFRQQQAKLEIEEESEEEEEVVEESEKRKGIQELIEIEDPNLMKPKNLKARDLNIGRPTELSRREREELKKQEAHERYMRLQEQGKTEQARKDLERLALVRAQRAEADRKRDEEKAAKEGISQKLARSQKPATKQY